MTKITGFNEVGYKDLQKLLNSHFDGLKATGKVTHVSIANCIDVSTQVTVMNALNCEKQVVSDKVLTGVMNCLNFEGKVLWEKGTRLYYVSNKHLK